MIFDLSVVTDTLTKLVTASWQAAPLWTAATPPFGITVTGLSPDATRAGHGAQLSMYLYHVDENNATESLFWTARSQAAGGPPIKYQPLALDLYYLLSAFSDGNYVQEQQAMSIAMRVFHENPIVRGASASGQPWELSLTFERRSYDELSRLWQATTSAMRMSAVYRAAVVLIEPEAEPPPGPPVSAVILAAEPSPDPRTPGLLGTQRVVRFIVPSKESVTFVQDPATAAAGQNVTLVGTGFNTIVTAKLLLTGPYPATGEVDVSAWLQQPTQPPSAIDRTVSLPAGGTGTPPTPAPGRYRLQMEVTAAPGAGSFSTAGVPLSIAAGINPAGGPILAPNPAGQYVITGTGFTAGATQVLLGTVLLQPAGAAPGLGEFSIDPAGTSITFVPPAGLRKGTYQIRVRVAGIESDPALWLVQQ